MALKTIVIDSLQAVAGQYVSGYIKVGEFATQSPIQVPVHIVNGVADGPVIWLNGGVHGDEINGPYAILELIKALKPENIHGAIIATPISNPLAFHQRQKITPQDFLDLDQQFPGNAKGTISQRIAAKLFSSITPYVTHIIDAHTVGSLYNGKPYTVFKRLQNPALISTYDEAAALARTFGGYAHCELDFSADLHEIPGDVHGFLDVQGLLQGIPSFMVELGSGGVIEREAVDWALRGYKKVLHSLGILTQDHPPEEHPAHPSVNVSKRKFVYSDIGGLIVDSVQSGEHVKKGERLVRIVNLLGEPTDILAEQDVYIIINRRNPVVESGDRLFFVATAWTENA